jgi:predicted DNA-binding transcriptional regulator YafY
LQLIIDCVQSSKFITQKYANELTEKLKKLTSKYGRATLNRRCFVVDRARSMNNTVFYGVDEIHSAIENDCKIKFNYAVYICPKNKKDDERVVSPVALIWNDSNYYLFATNGKRYRVDRMSNIAAKNEPREGMENYSKSKILESTSALFTAFSGTPEYVELRFANYLTNVAIDRFGNKSRLVPLDDEHFTIRTKVEISQQFYGWLCGLGNGVKIISPEWVVDGMKKHVMEIAKMYESDTNTQKDV